MEKTTPSEGRNKKKQIERTVTLLVILLISFSAFTAGVSAEESSFPEAPVFVDGKPVTTKYFLKEGHLMVPALFMKHAGARVDWNEEYQSVVFRLGDVHFAAPVNKKFTDDFDRRTSTWKRGTIVTAPVMHNGIAYVPLADVARKMGMTVSYNFDSHRTFINTHRNTVSRRIAAGSSRQKLVALTFDDGPESHYTPQILDILKEKGVPATFFVVGRQIQRHPEMMRRIINEGHGAGNHTWSHPSLPDIMTNNVVAEVRNTQNELARVTGRRPDLFRPPYGAITRSDEQLLYELGFRQIFWSVDTLDWTGLTGEQILAIVRRDITPGGIILQHNIETSPDLLQGTVDALPRIIDELQAQGYKFVTVQTLLDQQ